MKNKENITIKFKEIIYFTESIYIYIYNTPLWNGIKNKAHLNNFITLKDAKSSVSGFFLDEKKSKYGTDVGQTTFEVYHTLAFFK